MVESQSFMLNTVTVIIVRVTDRNIGVKNVGML